MGINILMLRILETLSSEEGNPISINELTRKIQSRYKSGNYQIVNKYIHQMVNERIVNTKKSGKSLALTLNFENEALGDLLTQVDLDKKQHFFEVYPHLQNLVKEISFGCKDLHYVNSISIINFSQNAKLNKLELLVLLKPSESEEKEKGQYIDNMYDRLHSEMHIENEKKELGSLMHSLSSKHNTRIDFLVVSRKEFHILIQSEEINQLKQMLLNKIVVITPELFWMEMIDLYRNGIRINLNEQIDTYDGEFNPIKITENDLIYNLTRYGYKEFGTKVLQGHKISIEYIITSLLMSTDPRRIEAIPVIIMKNIGMINREILAFVVRKYNVLEMLIDILNERMEQPMKDDIKEKLKPYNAAP